MVHSVSPMCCSYLSRVARRLVSCATATTHSTVTMIVRIRRSVLVTPSLPFVEHAEPLAEFDAVGFRQLIYALVYLP